MSKNPPLGLRVVIYEGRGAIPLSADRLLAIAQALLEIGYCVTRSRTGGNVSAAGSGPLVVLGQFERPELMPQAAADGSAAFFCREIAELDPAAVVAIVEAVRQSIELPKPKAWKPWFPVIDFGRCTNCMQCLSFCLFDVYGVSATGKIQVQNQANCKTDCPACSRVCPEVAILFPKYKSGPINGDEIDAEDLRRESMKVDISALLGGDIYAMLRDRSERAKSRFSKERDDERALKERQRCLAKLQEQFDVPAEVLAALPSLEQIQANAAAAQRRAQQATQS